VRALLGPGAWRTYHATAQIAIPLCHYYAITAPAIAGAGFTRDSTTTRSPSIDSLDSASGYFDIGVFSSVCSVCVHFWGPPSAPALHTACVRRRQRARATGAGSPGALLHARILSYARLWVQKKPSWSTRRPGSRRDEPGPGGVRVGATRTDLDCRVVATSRRVAPTECDSRLPLFSRASDSSTPGRHALATRGGSGIRLVAWLDSCVATCRPDRVRLVRYTSHVGRAQLVRLVRLCRTLSDEDVTAHATRQTCVRSKVRSTRRLVTRQTPRTLSDEDVTVHATRQTCVRSKVRSTRRLVSDSSHVI